MEVSVANAKNNLPKLLKTVEDGESVTICRRGAPVADLVPTSRSRRRVRTLGGLKGRVQIPDPNWWKPMSEKELKAFMEGRY